MRTLSICLCMLVWAAGCSPEPVATPSNEPIGPARTLEEANGRLRPGMSEEEVTAIMGGRGPSDDTSDGTPDKRSDRFPIDIPDTPADEREFFVGPKVGLVVCYKEDKLVAWALSTNRAPLAAKSAKLRIGQTYAEVRKIMGPDQSNYPGWNGKFLGQEAPLPRG